MSIDSDVWYELETSILNINDWFASSGTFDTKESALARLKQVSIWDDSREYRIVRKVLIVEVVE